MDYFQSFSLPFSISFTLVLSIYSTQGHLQPPESGSGPSLLPQSPFKLQLPSTGSHCALPCPTADHSSRLIARENRCLPFPFPFALSLLSVVATCRFCYRIPVSYRSIPDNADYRSTPAGIDNDDDGPMVALRLPEADYAPVRRIRSGTTIW